MGLTDIRAGIRDAVHAATEITAYEYRPASFTTTPLVYVDVPSYERRAYGRGTGAMPVTMEIDVVLIVAGTWDRSTQKTLDELMPVVHHALEADRTLGGAVSSCAVLAVRGLKARTNAVEGTDSAPVGAVYELQVEAII